MKKIQHLLCALVLFISLTGYSQDDIRFGLFLQPGFSYTKADANNVEAKGGMSFGWGLTMDKIFREKYAFSTGFTHHFYNVEADYTLAADSLTTYNDVYSFKIQHIEIPVTLKLRTKDYGHFAYFGQLGLLAGVPIRSRYDRENSINSTSNVENEKARNYVGLVNMGLLIAAGVEYNIGEDNTRLFGALDFNQGFANFIRDKDILGDDDNRKITLGTVSLKVGVFF